MCFVLQGEFGIDWGGPIPHSDRNSDGITVPDTPTPLNRADMDELQRIVSPLHSSTNYGIDIYERALHFVSEKLGCTL